MLAARQVDRRPGDELEVAVSIHAPGGAMPKPDAADCLEIMSTLSIVTVTGPTGAVT